MVFEKQLEVSFCEGASILPRVTSGLIIMPLQCRDPWALMKVQSYYLALRAITSLIITFFRITTLRRGVELCKNDSESKTRKVVEEPILCMASQQCLPIG